MAKKLKIWRTFGEEDMPDFIEITVISTKVINQSTDWLQQWTEHGARHTARRTSHSHNINQRHAAQSQAHSRQQDVQEIFRLLMHLQ